MNLTFKILKQEYHAHLAHRFLSGIDFWKIVNTISHNLETLGQLPSVDNVPIQDGTIRVYKDNNTYAIYYDNIRIILSVINRNEKLMQVSLLGDNEEWKVTNIDSKGKVSFDITSADTQVYTVFTACDTLIPTGRVISDERYTSGTWNEYVYHSTFAMIEYVLSFNKTNKFNKLYENKINKQNESTDC